MKRAVVLSFLLLASCKPAPVAEKSTPTPAPVAANVPTLVAHAGGGIGGEPVSNTKEALDAAHAAGYRWFEVDFSWTTDGDLACVQSWGELIEQQFGGARGRMSLAEFGKLKRKDGRTALTRTTAMEWLAAHPDATFVIDAKEEPLRALQLIAKEHAALLPRLVAQAYDIPEIEPASKLGFKGVIFSIYLMDASDAEIAAAAVKAKPFAVAMEPGSATPELLKPLQDAGIPVYVHTINDKAQADSLFALGVAGLYSDTLLPKDIGSQTSQGMK